MIRAAAVACVLLLGGCFPSLDEYGACAEGGCGGATGAGTTGSSSSSGSGTSGTQASTSGSSAGGGTGASSSSGGGSGGGASSSSGGGGGGGDPCLAPGDRPLVQDGALVEGESLGTPYAFCMDHAEVTHASYRAFWSAVNQGDFDPAPALEEKPQCAWQEPDADALVPAFLDLDEADWNATSNPEHPMVNVDWCDAHTYCAWAGKRLCGGTGGNPISYKQEQIRNEWYLACSNGDQRSYCYAEDGDNTPVGCVTGSPNGSTCPAYEATLCKSAGDCGGWTGLWEASESATCAAAASPSLVNLSGNVAEWIDACVEDVDAPGGYRCEARGGSCPMSYYTSCHYAGRDPATGEAGGPPDYTNSEVHVQLRAVYTGFRCCWDPE